MKNEVQRQVAFGTFTFIVSGLIDAFAHTGPTGLAVSLIGAFVCARHGPECYDFLMTELCGFEQYPGQLLPPPTKASSVPLLAQAEGPRYREIPEQCRGDELYQEEGDVILSPDLVLPLNAVAGKAIFVCGIRRHGKTTFGALLAEQLGKHYIPLFIPCAEGDYISLADVLPRAVIAGHSSADARYRNYEFAAVDSDEAAYQFGYDLLEYGYQAILDMASYETLDQAIGMQVNIVRGMFHWANKHPDERVPAHVFFDEAQRYLPQALSDSVIQNRDLLMSLLNAYMDIISIGGKRGIAPVVLTQRFAQVNKKIMAQSELYVLMRQTNDNDLDRCMEYVSGGITKEAIAKFRPGQGVFIADDGSQVVTKFYPRASSGDRSRTPNATSALRYETMPMSVQSFPATPKDAQKTSSGTPPLSRELQEVLDVYKPGMSYRALAKELDIGKDKAGELIAQLRSLNLLNDF